MWPVFVNSRREKSIVSNCTAGAIYTAVAYVLKELRRMRSLTVLQYLFGYVIQVEMTLIDSVR